MYCIFAELTNSNVLGKLLIRDSNNRELVDLEKYNTHVLTNIVIDNKLYCYSNDFTAIFPSTA